MKQKLSLNRLFDNKKFLSLFSVAMSLLLYTLVAMTTNDNVTYTIYNVPVRLDLQTANLTNLKLSVIEGDEFRADIVVKGPRTVVGHLNADSPELATTARFPQITQPGTYSLPITSAYSDPARLQFSIESYSIDKIPVRLDRLISRTFPVTPVIEGISVEPGYVLDSETITPENIVVTGPETELEKISEVRAELALTSSLLSTIARDQIPIKLSDAQGNSIAAEEKHISLDHSAAQIVVTVLKEVTLPLGIEIINQPRDFPLDELLETVTMSASATRIAGPAAVVDKLSEIRLGYIDIKALRPDSDNFSFSLRLSDISEQIKSLENTRNVSVKFDSENWLTASFNTRNIRLINIPPLYDIRIADERIENIEFVGDAEALAGMTADDIVVEIDFSERALSKGQQKYPVKISAPGKGLVWATGSYSVIIQAYEK